MVPDILYTIMLFFESYRIFWIVLSEVSMLYEVIYLGNLRWSLLAYAESRASLSQNPMTGPITRKGTISPGSPPRIDG